MFLLGWAAGLTIAFAIVYAVADASDVSSDSSAGDMVSWGTIVLGVVLLLLAVRSWRKRPAPGVMPEMPAWMAGMDSIAPATALGLGAALSAANPKNLILVVGAATGLAQLGLPTRDAVVSLVVFVVIGSLSVLGPVVYHLLGGERATRTLEELESWLVANNAAVMAVLFLVFGAVLISNGLASLTD